MLDLHFQVTNHHGEKPKAGRRNHRAEDAYWLTLGVTFCLSYIVQTHLPGNDTAHSRLGPPPSVYSQESAATPTGQSGGGNSAAKFPPSQVC